MATGTAVGGATGAAIGVYGLRPGTDVGLILFGGAFGALLGAIVAIIPAAIGAVCVTNLGLPRTSARTVEYELTVVFGCVVGLLNIGVLALLVASGGALLEPLPLLLLDNLAGGLVLWRAHSSIARALSEA